MFTEVTSAFEPRSQRKTVPTTTVTMRNELNRLSWNILGNSVIQSVLLGNIVTELTAHLPNQSLMYLHSVMRGIEMLSPSTISTLRQVQRSRCSINQAGYRPGAYLVQSSLNVTTPPQTRSNGSSLVQRNYRPEVESRRSNNRSYFGKTEGTVRRPGSSSMLADNFR